MSSLIDQAAKRLEALRRSGAELPDGLGLNTAPDLPGASLSTPEAVVRAIEAQRQRAEASGGDPLAHVRSPDEVRVRPTPLTPPRPAKPARFAAIDLDRLKARGFITPDAGTSQIAEEFRVVKRPIIGNVRARDGARVEHGNLVMVTSAVPGEGKTFTAVNLAMSIAMEYDHTVLLVDGDVAHPSLPDLLGIPDRPGLLEVLTDPEMDIGDALVKTNIEKLTVLPAGSPQRRATELLASEQMLTLLSELSTRYPDRIVVFDSPPLLSTTEARVLASRMGQILLVVAAETTSQNTLAQALATIESCEVVLTMLNKASATGIGTYYGYYAAERE
jgi:receptor protein-tyrosine kinase